MTPNLNANPLAALITNASTSPATTDSAQTVAGFSSLKSIEPSESERKFFDILQLHKTESSVSIEDFLSVGHTFTRAITQTTPGQAQPIPGLPVAGQPAGVFFDSEQVLNPNSEAIDVPREDLLTATLPIPVAGESQLTAELQTGARPPERGKPLPPSPALSKIAEQIRPQGALDFNESLLPPKPLVPGGLMPPEPGPAAASIRLAQQPLTPEFAQELVKIPKLNPAVGGAGAPPVLTQGFAESTLSTSDLDGANAEMIRGTSTISTVERPSLVQATVPIPLSRLAGAPGWDQGLGQRLLWMVDNGLNKAELRLDPPHLGSVNVRISMQDDQAQLLFQAAHPAAREALESALPRLREMFAQEGLELGSTDISDQNDQAGQSEQEQDHVSDDSTRGLTGTEHQSADEKSSLSGNNHSPDSAGLNGHQLIDEFV